jgi:hypothetical protein
MRALFPCLANTENETRRAGGLLPPQRCPALVPPYGAQWRLTVPLLTDTSLGELAMLCRSGSVDEFAKRFMALSCRDPSITEPQQIQLFIMGLDDPLRLDIALQQPASMDDAIIFARAYEQRLASQGAEPQLMTRVTSRVGARITP